MKLTDNSVFERPIDEKTGDWINTRSFLPGAYEQRDIHLMRENDNALVDIPQKFVSHSPSGFEYGYGGSGPADLALNILGLFVSPPEAYRLHQKFKWDRIAPLARDLNHTITADSVRDWIQDYWHLEIAQNNGDIPL